MRFAGSVVVASLMALPAFANLAAPTAPQPSSAPVRDIAAAEQPIRLAEAGKKAVRKSAPAKRAVAKKSAHSSPAARDAFNAMPLAERVSLQFDLAWTGDYNGLINGEFNDRIVAAVKSFQSRNGIKDGGALAPPDRAMLASSSKNKQALVGWTMVDDRVTGAQVGMPTKQVPNAASARSGTRWSSAQGQIQVETFRVRGPGTTLANVFEQQKKEPPNRRLEVNLMRDNFFVLSGMQGLKKFYVRAEYKDLEVRGLTILYDQATEGVMDPIVVVMSSTFAPFPGSGITDLLAPPGRPKVEYGTGIVVSSAGHILTDRQLTEGCKVLQVASHGDASRIADDAASNLVLLRVSESSALVPGALVHEGARGPDLTLVGIADPQAQGGTRTASTATARLDGENILPAPPPGFAGAAALDSRGRLLGMVTLKTAVIAAAGAAAPPLTASVVPVDRIIRFLDTRYITPATGRAGADATKASLVRVICVRR